MLRDHTGKNVVKQLRNSKSKDDEPKVQEKSRSELINQERGKEINELLELSSEIIRFKEDQKDENYKPNIANRVSKKIKKAENIILKQSELIAKIRKECDRPGGGLSEKALKRSNYDLTNAVKKYQKNREKTVNLVKDVLNLKEERGLSKAEIDEIDKLKQSFDFLCKKAESMRSIMNQGNEKLFKLNQVFEVNDILKQEPERKTITKTLEERIKAAKVKADNQKLVTKNEKAMVFGREN